MYLCMVGFGYFEYSVLGRLFVVLLRLLDDILIFIGVAHPSRSSLIAWDSRQLSSNGRSLCRMDDHP